MNNMNFGKFSPKNNVVDLKGPSHEKGGIPLSKDIEAEGNESMIGNFMFSNRLLTKDNKSFSEQAKKIESKYKKDNSAIAIKSKKKELERLASEQEELKQSMNNTSDTNNSEPTKMFAGGAIAGVAGGAINMARGLFEKPREYDDISMERAKWQDATFDKVKFDNVDYSEQRNQAALDTERNRQIGDATIRNNASTSGQLLSNSLFNNARASTSLNSINRDSFMNENNMNTQIQNQAEQINVGTANQFSQFNTQGKNQTNMFNTQIGNQELMTNFGIQQQNDANKDAKTQMIYDGLGQMIGGAGNFSNDMLKFKQDQDFMKNVYNGGYNSLDNNYNMFGFKKKNKD